ncbi:hypothetical protein RMATCC62417_11777 [Rhizopus microsporus]|nr:hypothetical protein RMATCC62417_11777 [Rhizopus microsporus]
MKYIILFFFFYILSVLARPSKPQLQTRLSKVGVNFNEIGCKCIMTDSTQDDRDTTLCLCFNRSNGTLNDSKSCSTLQDGVFQFCNDVTQDTSAWQRCVKQFCPCT